MSERVQITMSVEAFRLMIACAMQQAREGIQSGMLLSALGQLTPDIREKLNREATLMSAMATILPPMPKEGEADPLETCPAPIYAIAVPDPENNSVYHAKKREKGAELRQRLGLPPEPPLN